jgi:hypothetical protein
VDLEHHSLLVVQIEAPDREYVAYDIQKAAGIGLYDVTYTPQLCGKYRLAVLVRGNHVENSPFTVGVFHGPVFAPCCTATGDGIFRAHLHMRASFFVLAADRCSNRLATGGENFRMRILSEQTSEVVCNIEYLDNMDGSYSAAYTIRSPGRYLLHLDLMQEVSVIDGLDEAVEDIESFEEHSSPSKVGMRFVWQPIRDSPLPLVVFFFGKHIYRLRTPLTADDPD